MDEQKVKALRRKLGTARFTLRIAPALWILALGYMGYALNDLLVHPGLVSALRIVSAAGILLSGAGATAEARNILRDPDDSIGKGVCIVGSMIGVFGGMLATAYREHDTGLIWLINAGAVMLAFPASRLLWLEAREFRERTATANRRTRV